MNRWTWLTDDAFDLDDLECTTLPGASSLYSEVVFSLLADDAASIEDFLKTAEKWTKKSRPVLAAHYQDFDRFFESMIRLKKLKGIVSSAIALRSLIDLANERMDQIDAETSVPSQKSCLKSAKSNSK